MFGRRALLRVVLGAVAAATLTGCMTGKKSAKAPASPPAGQTAEKSVASSGEKVVARPKSFDLGAMDKSVNPCEDFYQYACGTWRNNNPIPSDQARWGRFNELAEYNRQFLHNILEQASADDSKRTPVMQKIGDMYQSCMDESTVNTKGSAP